MKSINVNSDPWPELWDIPPEMASVLDGVDNLPTLPQVFATLNRIIDNKQSSARDLVQVISADQALTARILKYANSPLFRGFHPIENVQQAVVRLGFQEVKDISLTVMVYEGLFRQSAGAYFNRVQFWKHSFLVGYACQALAEKLLLNSLQKVAFVAGLLHDIGVVILDKFFPTIFSRLITAVDGRREPLEEVEVDSSFPPHGAIGAHVLSKWRLPEPVADAVAFHHGPAERFGANPLAGIIYLSDFIVRKAGYPFYVSEKQPKPEMLKRTIQLGLGEGRPGGKRLARLLSESAQSFREDIPGHLDSLKGVLSGF